MAYSVQLLEDLPVLLVSVGGGFSQEDFFNLVVQVRQTLDSVPSPVFHITDFRESLIPLDEMMIGASEVARGDVSLFNHPMIRENVFVAKSEYLAMVAQGLDSEAFGYQHVQVFDTLEKALAYVRAAL